MKVGNITNKDNFKIISVKYIKSATKDYPYYNGTILKGTSYYRGFGTRSGVPFEFFFTEELLYKRRKIKLNILKTEFEDYWFRRCKQIYSEEVQV